MRSAAAAIFALTALWGCGREALLPSDFGPGKRKREEYVRAEIAGPRIGTAGEMVDKSQFTLDELLRFAIKLASTDRRNDVLQKLPPGCRLEGPFSEVVSTGVVRESFQVKGGIFARVDFVQFLTLPTDPQRARGIMGVAGKLGTADFVWIGAPADPMVLIKKINLLLGEPVASPEPYKFELTQLGRYRAIETGLVMTGYEVAYLSETNGWRIDGTVGNLPAKYGALSVVQLSAEFNGWPTLD